MKEQRKVYYFEAIFFIFFGVMHLSRIWGLFDRQSYADAWLGMMYGKGAVYYILMTVMALLCITGIVIFIIHRGQNAWWRWIFVFGGGYILFDLFAIAAGLKFWENALLFMFDVEGMFWYPIWGSFILIGFFCFLLGVLLCKRLYVQRIKDDNK